MADITMNVDDTLELDTIIKNSNIALDPVSVSSDNNSNYNIQGFKTHTCVFDPVDSDIYTIDINGQELTIEVVDDAVKPIDDFSDGNLTEYEDYGGDTVGGLSESSIVSESNTSVPDSNSLSIYTTSKDSGIHAPKGDSAINYPVLGDNFYGYFYPKNGQDISFAWCRTNSGEDTVGYYITISPDRNNWSIIQGANYYSNVSSSDYEKEDVSLAGNWYIAEVVTNTSEIYVNLTDITNETSPTNLTLNLSETSNKPTSGGISFYANENNSEENLRFNGFKIDNSLTK